MPDLPTSDSESIRPPRPTRPGSAPPPTPAPPHPAIATASPLGPDGPILLHDVHFLNQMAHFNRERVPERDVHAKGSGAFGSSRPRTTSSVHEGRALPARREDRDAGPLLHRGRRAGLARHLARPARLRPEVLHDEGNCDLVGNNTPVFFIRDPMKFPDFIRSQKRRGDSGLRDANMQWDFWSLNPESVHQVTYLFGDRGTPSRSAT